MSQRLDRELVDRGLARSRQQAQEAVRAQKVRLNGVTANRPATHVGAADVIEISDIDPYVSRAAHKLAGALRSSGTTVPERVLDAGASTGGFTQVVLEAGAQRVYAVDVGHDQLAASLRGDQRVVVRERCNVRDLSLSDLDGEPVSLVVGDVSFISLTLLLEPLLAVLAAAGSALLLVKPQFEVGRAGLDHRGVVRSAALRDEAVARVIAKAADLGWRCDWRGVSDLAGESGNVEYFLRLVSSGGDVVGRG